MPGSGLCRALALERNDLAGLLRGRRRDERTPSVHQRAPVIHHRVAHAGAFDPFSRSRCDSASSRPAWSVSSAGARPIAETLLKPCGTWSAHPAVHVRPNDMSDIQFLVGKHRRRENQFVARRIRALCLSTCTRHATAARRVRQLRLVRSAGIVHIFAASSISAHRAPRASPLLVAVNARNSRHILTAALARSYACRLAMNAGTSAYGTEGKCRSSSSFGGCSCFAAATFRMMFAVTCPRSSASSNTARDLLLHPLAGFGRLPTIGINRSSISFVVMSAMCLCPTLSSTVRKLANHCVARAFRIEILCFCPSCWAWKSRRDSGSRIVPVCFSRRCWHSRARPCPPRRRRGRLRWDQRQCAACRAIRYAMRGQRRAMFRDSARRLRVVRDSDAQLVAPAFRAVFFRKVQTQSAAVVHGFRRAFARNVSQKVFALLAGLARLARLLRLRVSGCGCGVPANWRSALPASAARRFACCGVDTPERNRSISSNSAPRTSAGVRTSYTGATGVSSFGPFSFPDPSPQRRPPTWRYPEPYPGNGLAGKETQGRVGKRRFHLSAVESGAWV